MKALIYIGLIALIGSTQVFASQNTQDKIVRCNSVNLKTQKKGFVCKTSSSTRFELLLSGDSGEQAWLGPNNIVWFDILPAATFDESIEVCANYIEGVQLTPPTFEEVKKAQLDGFDEVLPNIKGDNFSFWTRSYEEVNPADEYFRQYPNSGLVNMYPRIVRFPFYYNSRDKVLYTTSISDIRKVRCIGYLK